MIFDCDGRSDVRKGRGEERSEKRRREEKGYIIRYFSDVGERRDQACNIALSVVVVVLGVEVVVVEVVVVEEKEEEVVGHSFITVAAASHLFFFCSFFLFIFF